ncbi:hypothetical protein [Arcanobacterium haemolyticum]
MKKAIERVSARIKLIWKHRTMLSKNIAVCFITSIPAQIMLGWCAVLGFFIFSIVIALGFLMLELKGLVRDTGFEIVAQVMPLIITILSFITLKVGVSKNRILSMCRGVLRKLLHILFGNEDLIQEDPTEEMYIRAFQALHYPIVLIVTVAFLIMLIAAVISAMKQKMSRLQIFFKTTVKLYSFAAVVTTIDISLLYALINVAKDAPSWKIVQSEVIDDIILLIFVLLASAWGIMVAVLLKNVEDNPKIAQPRRLFLASIRRKANALSDGAKKSIKS